MRITTCFSGTATHGGLRFALGATIASRKSLLHSLPEFKTLVNRAR